MNLSFLTDTTNFATQLGISFIAFIPNLLGGVLLIILGIILGNWVKLLLVRGLGAMKLESIIKDNKIRSFLESAEITGKIEEVIGSFVKWLIVLTFFISATNLWGLTTIANLLMGILSFIPNIFSAVIVLALGVLLAGFVESMVKGGLSSLDLGTARLMGKISSYLVVVIALLAALSELSIAKDFINIIFIGFVAMLALGFGLAIGLGSKDLVAKVLNRWAKNLL